MFGEKYKLCCIYRTYVYNESPTKEKLEQVKQTIPQYKESVVYYLYLINGNTG